MVAQPHEAPSRHNELLRAAQDIADLKVELAEMTAARNANKARADRAEAVNRQLETQLKTDKREIKTLYVKTALVADLEKLDSDLAKMTSAGWERFDSGIIPGDNPIRFITLIRVAPLEPATDQPPITAAVAPTIPEVATVQPQAILTEENAQSSISGLWNALYQMDRFVELVQHWPKLPEYAPRVYAVFEAAGCDMADVVIMKSFRMGHRADEATLKAIFPKSTQIIPGTRTALVAAGFGNVVHRDGREFIFDLPAAWVGAPRKTITAASMTIIDETAAPAVTEGNASGMTEGNPAGTESDTEMPAHRAEMMDVAHKAFNAAMDRNPLPPYRQLSTPI